MPWNDQNGGGKGPWGSGGGSDGDGKNNSPWGRPTGNGGNQGPDLEDQLRKVQDRFKGAWGGRNGRGSGSGGGGGKGLGIAGVLLLGGALAVAWISTGVVIVDAGEQAAVFQFGKWQRNLSAGIHVHLPSPIESHVVIRVEEQQEVQIGDRSDESLMLTQDENIADIQFSVYWKIKSESPQDYILNVKDPDETVQMVAESVMREVVGKSELQRVITDERSEVANQVREQTQALLDEYRAGVDILDVQIRRGDPPGPVIQAFNDVNVAQQDAEQVINEATRYSNQVVPEARGEASQILQNAEGYRDQVIANASGEASRFNQIYEEYRQAPRVTKERMYLETMERVLSRMDKTMLDNNAGAVPYLPLDRARGNSSN
ncbi:MAG: FtsH protease activity modulator HflK [Ponticaulis sp.]|nr:FtsH protease activity modulator HflK [Ponticaulis sp.]